MKNLKAPFLVIALLFLNFSFADPSDMPVPYGTTNDDGSTTEDDDGVFPGNPPDFPIDENITFLFVSSLILGASAIYKNQIKKASI